MVLMSFVNSPTVPILSGSGTRRRGLAGESRLFRHVRLLIEPNEHGASTFQKTPTALALEQGGRREDLKSCWHTGCARAANVSRLICLTRVGYEPHMTKVAARTQNLLLSRAAQAAVFALNELDHA
jgi:hypothetical protein